MVTTPTRWGGEVTFSNDPLAYGPDVVGLANNGFTIVWQAQDDSQPLADPLFGRRFTPLGSFSGGDFLDGQAFNSVVTVQSNGVEVVYTTVVETDLGEIEWNGANVQDSPYPETVISAAPAYLGGFAEGTAITYATNETPGSSETAHVLLFVNGIGLPASNPIYIDAVANDGETTLDSDVAMLGNGNVVVAYTDFNTQTSTSTVRYHIYTGVNGGSSISGPFDANATPGNDSQPSVAGLKLKSDAFVIATQDALGIRYLFKDGPNSFFASVPGTLGPGPNGFPKAISPQVLALADGGFVIAWSDTTALETDGSPAIKIGMQRFGANGQAIGANFFIDNPGDQNITSMALLDDGRFIVTFSNETGDSTNLTTLKYQIFDPREQTIYGSSGADNITSREDGATIDAGAGDDTLNGRAGNDLIYGGAGNDTVDGSLGNDLLYGDGGNDILIGGLGSDLLFGGAGKDTLNGGDGFDYARYDTEASGVAVRIDLGGRYVGGVLDDTFIGIEGIVGSYGHDTLVGGAGTNVIYGLDGNDYLLGLGGLDALYGGGGADAFLLAYEAEAGITDYVLDYQPGLDVLYLPKGLYGQFQAAYGDFDSDGGADDTLLFAPVGDAFWAVAVTNVAPAQLGILYV